jgi:hypothetical protein
MSENPYSSPQVIQFSPTIPAKLTAWQFLKLLLGAIGIGAALGGITNTINGAVWPAHFEMFFSRNLLDDILFGSSLPLWPRTILWGMLEGSVYGFANGLLYVFLIAVFADRRAILTTVWKYMFAVGVLVFVLVIVGGVWGFAGAMQPKDWDPLTAFLLEGLTFLPNEGGKGWIFGSMRLSIMLSPLCVIAVAYLYIRRHRYRVPDAATNSEV